MKNYKRNLQFSFFTTDTEELALLFFVEYFSQPRASMFVNTEKAMKKQYITVSNGMLWACTEQPDLWALVSDIDNTFFYEFLN